MTKSTLTKAELDTWRAFRFMVEEASLSVSRTLMAATDMSGGQFGILTTIAEHGKPSIRQQELADAMRWDRTRLSHQLTRMEARGWIARKKEAGAGTLVSLTEAGWAAREAAVPELGRILKEKFFSRLTPAHLEAINDIRRALAAESPPG